MKPETRDQAVHRPGPSKQENKRHKTGRHRSKGILEILKKGIINTIKTLNLKY